MSEDNYNCGFRKYVKQYIVDYKLYILTNVEALLLVGFADWLNEHEELGELLEIISKEEE